MIEIPGAEFPTFPANGNPPAMVPPTAEVPTPDPLQEAPRALGELPIAEPPAPSVAPTIAPAPVAVFSPAAPPALADLERFGITAAPLPNQPAFISAPVAPATPFAPSPMPPAGPASGPAAPVSTADYSNGSHGEQSRTSRSSHNSLAVLLEAIAIALFASRRYFELTRLPLPQHLTLLVERPG